MFEKDNLYKEWRRPLRREFPKTGRKINAHKKGNYVKVVELLGPTKTFEVIDESKESATLREVDKVNLMSIKKVNRSD